MADRPNILTAERDAVWDSIRGYEPLKGSGVDGTIFRVAYRWKEPTADIRWDLLQIAPPPIVLIPAFEIRTVGGDDRWLQHQGKRLTHRMACAVWTQFHDQDAGAEIWKQIRRALHQVPKRARTYLRDASGVGVFRMTFPVPEFLATDRQIVTGDDGEQRLTVGAPCTRTSFEIEIDHTDNPELDSD